MRKGDRSKSKLQIINGKQVYVEPWLRDVMKACKNAGVEWTPDLSAEEQRRLKFKRRERIRLIRDKGLPTNLDYAANERLARTAVTMVEAARRRSTIARPFDIDAKWLLEKLRAGACEKTGLPFDFFGETRMFSPSIDQIKPSEGYTKANCQVVVWCYNAAKGVGTDVDVLVMARALVEKSKE